MGILVALGILFSPQAWATLTPAGIRSLNGLTEAAQTLVVGSAGSDFAIASSGAAHTVNLPTASATKRGLLSAADWSTFSAKQASGSYLTALTGDVTASGPGSAAATIANLAVTNAKIANGTVDLAAKVTGLLPVANQASQPHTQVIQVDMNRADSYTADGSLTRPYKTLKAAIVAQGSGCQDNTKCEFHMAPGHYVEDNDLTIGPWQYLIGAMRDAVTIDRGDASAVVVDLTASAAHRLGMTNVTFVHGLTIDRTGATLGGASVDLREVWVAGAFTYLGRGSGSDYIHMKNCYILGAVSMSGLSGIINTSNFLSTLTMGTAGATEVDGLSYYGLMTFQSSYIAGNISATAAAAKPAAYQFFSTYGDGNWDINGTGAIDLYTDMSGTLGAFATYTKTNVTTYRYGSLENVGYIPGVAGNWGSVPTNAQDALDYLATGALKAAVINGASTSTNAVVTYKDGHLRSTQTTAPVATVDGNAGSGASCTVANATDTAGAVSITTGTIGVSTGAYCSIAFNKAYNVAPICILTPASSTLSTSVYVTSSTSAVVVNFALAGGISSTYVLNYHCVETQ